MKPDISTLLKPDILILQRQTVEDRCIAGPAELRFVQLFPADAGNLEAAHLEAGSFPRIRSLAVHSEDL